MANETIEECNEDIGIIEGQVDNLRAQQLANPGQSSQLQSEINRLLTEQRALFQRRDSLLQDDPTTAVYRGVVENEQYRYVNNNTGNVFTNPTPPSTVQITDYNRVPPSLGPDSDPSTTGDYQTQGYGRIPTSPQNVPATPFTTGTIGQGATTGAINSSPQADGTAFTLGETNQNVLGTIVRSPVSPGQGDFTGAAQNVANERVIGQKGIPTDVQILEDGSRIEKFDDGSEYIVSPNGERTTIAGPAGQTFSISENVAGSVDAARSKPVIQNTRLSREQSDWRIKLSLAPESNYLYKVANETDILYPLKATDGVIFPYTPQITSSYRATYDPTDIPHTNYKQYFYRNSSVEDITITADFTAQDNTEALYLLATIHFFRSVTKMFYGQDSGPSAGTPPPLCYLFGYGRYQYNDHPLLVTNFNYSLPNDVDYIRAGSTAQAPGVSQSSYPKKPDILKPTSWKEKLSSLLRLSSSGLSKGGITPETTWNYLSSTEATYVPTKMQITLTCIPIVTRSVISNTFSVRDYATGNLLRNRGVW